MLYQTHLLISGIWPIMQNSYSFGCSNRHNVKTSDAFEPQLWYCSDTHSLTHTHVPICICVCARVCVCVCVWVSECDTGNGLYSMFVRWATQLITALKMQRDTCPLRANILWISMFFTVVFRRSARSWTDKPGLNDVKKFICCWCWAK